MRQTVIKGFPLAAALASMLLGLGSCTKQESSPEEVSPEVVASAEFLMSFDDAGTKASLNGAYLDWQVGDQIVMASNGQINGTLVCKSVDGSGKASFRGTICNFTPAGVNLYFLGNKAVDSMNPQFDFSGQQGSNANASNYIFLKKIGVELSGKEGVYSPTEAVVFEGMTTLLTLTLDPAGSPGAESGTLASSVIIDGLKQVISINLADGTTTASYAKMLDGTTDKTTTTVAPVSVVNYSNTYVVAVVPQNAANLTMRVNYLRADSSTAVTLWSDINWDLSAKAGKRVKTNWTNAGKVPTIVTSSMKYGYSGQAVEGGETADGKTNKGGYGGANVGDESDNPSGSKPGYGGAEVL